MAYPGWNFDLGFLVWFGFLPLFMSLDTASQKSTKQLFTLGYIASLSYLLIVFGWFWSFHPLDTIGLNNRVLSFLLILALYLITSGSLALFGSLFSYAFSKFSRRSFLISFASIAGVFVLLEYLRSIGFGTLWFGSGTLIGPHWTMGNIAYSLVGNSFALRLSSFIGIYGLSFIVVSINLLLYHLLNKKNRWLFGIILIGLVGSHFVDFSPTTSGNSLAFALVQTNQPTKINYRPAEKLENFKIQLNLLNTIAIQYPETEMIVFPEGSDFLKDFSLFLSPAQAEKYFRALFAKPVLLISGMRALENEDNYSRVLMLDTRGDIIDYYDKRVLTPGGEFLPYILGSVIKISNPEGLSGFTDEREFSIGKKASGGIDFRGKLRAAPLICSELLGPSSAKIASSNSEALVVLGSTSIFHGWNGLINEALAMARFRAAENKKPLVFAANMGRSYSISKWGKTEKITPNSNAQILTGFIIPSHERSWYNRLGDWPILLVSGLMIGITFFTKNVTKA